MAERQMAVFRDAENVVIASGSCGAMVKVFYPELFHGQPREAEAKAFETPARSVRGGYGRAPGMVRGRAVAHIARTVRAATSTVSGPVSGRATADMPAPSQGMATRGRPKIGIRGCAAPHYRSEHAKECASAEQVDGNYPVDLPLRLDDAGASPTTPQGPSHQPNLLRKEMVWARNPEP